MVSHLVDKPKRFLFFFFFFETDGLEPLLRGFHLNEFSLNLHEGHVILELFLKIREGDVVLVLLVIFTCLAMSVKHVTGVFSVFDHLLDVGVMHDVIIILVRDRIAKVGHTAKLSLLGLGGRDDLKVEFSVGEQGRETIQSFHGGAGSDELAAESLNFKVHCCLLFVVCWLENTKISDDLGFIFTIVVVVV